MRYWDNRWASLFLVTRDNTKHLPYTAIKIIEWDGRTTLDIDNDDILLKDASVTLESTMPHDIYVFSVWPSAEFHLTLKDCGLRENYSKEDLVLVMESINYEYRAMRNLAIVSMSDVSRIDLEVVFRCNVRLVGLAYND